MVERDIFVPEAMRKAFGRGTQDVDPDGYLAYHGLEQVILWLTDILHERNPDFHRAILKREKERIPGDDDDTYIIGRRVDFEYGVSFARNYIRDLFREPETQASEAVKDLLWKPKSRGTELDRQLAQYDESHDADVIEAYRRGQKSVTK